LAQTGKIVWVIGCWKEEKEKVRPIEEQGEMCGAAECRRKKIYTHNTIRGGMRNNRQVKKDGTICPRKCELPAPAFQKLNIGRYLGGRKKTEGRKKIRGAREGGIKDLKGAPGGKKGTPE